MFKRCLKRIKILNIFIFCYSTSNAIPRRFQKKASLLVLKSGFWTVERWDRCISSEGRYFGKEWFIYCCKYISWFFYDLIHNFMECSLYIRNFFYLFSLHNIHRHMNFTEKGKVFHNNSLLHNKRKKSE